MSKILNPDPETILDLFCSKKKIVVPKYQRNFKWGRNEASELIEDIKARVSDPSSHLFLGTVIFDVSGEHDGIAVIDGQQRITTISLLLIACRQVIAKTDPQYAAAIQEKIAFKDPITGAYQDQRLVVSRSIQDMYRHISQESWAGTYPDRIGGRSVKRQANRIRPLIEYFIGEVSQMAPEDLKAFVKSLYEAYFVRIDIENTAQAFDIFERMNARGIPLDVADLLKNHLFAQIDTSDIEERWLGIIENSGETPLRMLKYFWISKNGYVRKSDLYRGMRDYCHENRPEAFVNELEDFSLFYWLVRDGGDTDINTYLKENGLGEIAANESYSRRLIDALQALRLFRITQLYPLLYSAVQAYKRDADRNPANLMGLFDTFERYHFINNVICERVGNEVEKLYADYARDFNTGEFNVLATNLKKALKSRLATKEEFVSNFTTLAYGQDSIALICYIFDRINNNLFGAKGGQRARIFFPDPSVQKKNFNVEHVLPQKLRKTSADKDLVEAIDNIGNLLVISRHTNSELGSLSPAQKIELIKGKPTYTNNLPYLHKFIEDHEGEVGDWGKDQISRRAEKLAKLGYEKIWTL